MSDVLNALVGGSGFHLPPTFPLTFGIGDATILLNADGTWEGDRDAFAKAVAASQGFGDPTAVLAWLILRAITDGQLTQKPQPPAPEQPRL